MFYCDQVCQKSDWSRHKYECKLYAGHYEEIDENLERFLLRMLLFLTNKPQSMSKKYSLFYDNNIGRSYDDLMTHKENITNDDNKCRKFAAICDKYENVNITFDKSQLFEMFCKICINSYSMLNTDLNGIGSGVYVAESMFDHSCTPNAAPVFNGIDLEIRCIKPIEEGEPITVNYIDLKESKSTRQKMLKEQYYFDCNCPRCEQDLPRGK